MISRFRVVLPGMAWLTSITLLHLWLNTNSLDWGSLKAQGAETRLRVGFIPVTCHLTCPVNHYITEAMDGAGRFEPVRFSGWPELKEAFLSGHLEATFILAPLAMTLREQGVPIKIVYLEHRDGTMMMVHTDSAIIFGEPFMAQTEIDGYGRVLFMTKDVWPEFISCVLAVNENVILQRRPEVQRLVGGIAQSGEWLDATMDHRMQSAGCRERAD